MIRRGILIFLFALAAGCKSAHQAALQGNEREPAIVITAQGQLLVNNELEELGNLGRRVKKARIPKDTPIYIQIQGEPTDPITQQRMKDVSTQIKLGANHSRFFFVTEREATAEVLAPGEKVETGSVTLNQAAPEGTPANAATPALRNTPRTAPLGSAANPRPANPRRSRWAR